MTQQGQSQGHQLQWLRKYLKSNIIVQKLIFIVQVLFFIRCSLEHFHIKVLFKDQLTIRKWSLNTCFLSFLSHTGKDDKDLLENIKTKPLVLEHSQIKISEKMKDLLRRMICYDRKYRIKWHELYKHNVFVQPTEKWFLAKFQNQRISLEQNGKFYNDNRDFIDNEIAPLNPENPSTVQYQAV